MMRHIIYKTTNLLNNKIYVGVHSTNNLDDGYLGSGQAIRTAIKKYGKTNFIRDVLFECGSASEAYDIEYVLVCPTFIKRKDVYNCSVGGLKRYHFDNCKFKGK